nr:hypothetical protein [Lachnospiraceae bacterium]
LTEYEKILSVIGRNRIIFPEGTPNEEKAEELLARQEAALGAEEGNTARKVSEEMPEISKEQFLQELEKLEEQLETFELEGIETVLGELLQYRYEGTALKELMETVKSKADAFDFIGAGEELEGVREKLR